MRKEITNPVGKWWVVANRCGDLHVTVKFPELNKGERIEMNLQFEFGIK